MEAQNGGMICLNLGKGFVQILHHQPLDSGHPMLDIVLTIECPSERLRPTWRRWMEACYASTSEKALCKFSHWHNQYDSTEPIPYNYNKWRAIMLKGALPGVEPNVRHILYKVTDIKQRKNKNQWHKNMSLCIKHYSLELHLVVLILSTIFAKLNMKAVKCFRPFLIDWNEKVTDIFKFSLWCVRIEPAFAIKKIVWYL